MKKVISNKVSVIILSIFGAIMTKIAAIELVNEDIVSLLGGLEMGQEHGQGFSIRLHEYHPDPMDDNLDENEINAIAKHKAWPSRPNHSESILDSFYKSVLSFLQVFGYSGIGEDKMRPGDAQYFQ